MDYNDLSAQYSLSFVTRVAEIIENDILPFPGVVVSDTADYETDVKIYFPTNFFGKKQLAVKTDSWTTELISDGRGREITMNAKIRIYCSNFPNNELEMQNMLKATNIVANYFHGLKTIIGANGLKWFDINIPSVRTDLIFPNARNYGSELDLVATANMRYS